jgi:7tm Chemosensory receptor.
MDVFQLLNPTLVLSRLFGLIPVVQQYRDSSNSKEYRLSKFWLVYSVMFICVQIVLEITMTWRVREELHEAVLITIFQALSRGSFIFVLGTRIVSMYYIRKLIHLLNKLSSLRLGKVNSKHGNTASKATACFIVCYTIAIIGFSYSLLGKFSVSKTTGLFFRILRTLRFLVTILPYLQLMHILIIVKYKFEALNLIIESLKLYPRGSFSMMSKSSIQMKCHQANKPDNRGFIKKLSYLHHSLCDLAEGFNSIFSVQVTVLLGMVFVQVTVSMYICTRTGLDTVVAMYPGIVLFSAKTLALLWSCNSISSQVKRNLYSNLGWI